jgi:hypothetical protein
MKNVDKKNRAQRAGIVFFILHFAFLTSVARAAEEFGDISVDPNAIYTGNTFHGYAETRVNLENHSHSKTHVVTLIYPNNSYDNYGNNLSRLSRTVNLAPDAREVVSLLQPPLPTQGDSSIRVEVDQRHEGEVHAPNANAHCNNYPRGGVMTTTFISRSLDYDAVERVFNADNGAFTAAMAVGAPDDTNNRSGYHPRTWMPDTRRGGETNWLELDFSTPQTMNQIIVYSIQPSISSGFISLVGISGTNVATISMASGHASSTSSGWPSGPTSSGWITEFSFPTTTEQVKTIQLNFGRTPPYNIAIDAVQVSGPAGSQWAAATRASSDNSASASSYGARGDSVECLRAESPVSEWSENWLAYSPFDAVVINATDLSSMPPAVLGAIEDYLQIGGNVVFFGKAGLPAAWHPSQKIQLSDGVVYSLGFGHCFAFDSENPSRLDPECVKILRAAVRDSALYWQSLPKDSGSANVILPVVASLKIPTRGIVIIMLAFVIIIGPVNIIYLNLRKRRTWMLWTIPAISFVTTLMVFAYSLVREGVTPDTLIVGLTVIDQTSHRAATIGGTAFYCPLTPSAGLHFDFETEATPLIQFGNGSGSSREVDWTQSQHLQRGWVSARVPAYFHLRKSETRRERIQIVNEHGKLQVVNSLGAPIKSLWLADTDGNTYRTYHVDAGQKVSLIPVAGTPVHFSDEKTNSLEISSDSNVSEQQGPAKLIRDVGFAFSRMGDLSIEGGVNNATKYLLPNTYIAVLDGNPFIENALGSASSPKRTKSSAVVFGILESSEAQ